ncbi:hypothetical protein JKP75_01860 [Blastococcus sp. TML/M2B]|uniref:hypothetical protein n=1 Tax=Blastococcus sp. TML/M2B TaxID=2798727 RepID=UPI00190C87E3|nr:hypothetical protein [Blastococcus sp. TML/M2B]MBN1091440.1 hypothetical protein [Blastococcus sp. TML/M2B]
MTGWAAPVLAGAAGVVWLLDGAEQEEPGSVLFLLAVGAIVATVCAFAFLRRVWAVAELAGDPIAVRCRRWADGAVATWGVALLLRVLVEQLLHRGGVWLDVVTTALGAVAVVAYVRVLVLTTRWGPAPSAGGDQL